MPVPWTPERGAYPTSIDGQPCVVTVDMGAVRHGAVSTHPNFLSIRVRLQRPLDSGLPIDAERAELDSLHERLEAEVVAAADGLFVARHCSSGFFYLGFYVPAAPQRSPNLTDGYDPYKPEFRFEADPEWRILHDEFAPDDWQQQLIETGRMMTQLDLLGDDHPAKRKVDHTILIPAGADRSAVLDRITEQGYTIDNVTVYDAETSINFSRLDNLTEPFARVTEAFELAQDCGGTYDGWGAPVTKP